MTNGQYKLLCELVIVVGWLVVTSHVIGNSQLVLIAKAATVMHIALVIWLAVLALKVYRYRIGGQQC